MRFVLSTIALMLLLAAPPALSDRALAMHGAPQEPATFTHFPYANPDAPKGGTLRLGITGSFDNINPFSLRGRGAWGANPTSGQLYLYDSLLARSQDEPFTLYALIAEDVSTPADRRSVTFRLNAAARFHDGQPITSADVHFSWETLRQKGRPNHRTYYNRVGRVDTPDARHITFHFKPNADGSYDRELPLILGLMPVLPQHVWAKLDMTAPSLTPPVGSGPYRIKNIDAGRSIVWERVADYWAQDLPSQRGLYNFQTIQVDYYRDEQVALQAFKSGQFDLRRETSPTRWDSGYTGSALEAGQFRLVTLPHKRVEAVKALAFNTRRPLFQDRTLRAAISTALDTAWLNRVLFRGALQAGGSYFPNSALAASDLPDVAETALLQSWRATLPPELFTQPLPVPATDFAAVWRDQQRRLLQAGYTLQDGALQTPQGQPVSFTILLNEPSDEKIALSLARNLRRLGITARVQVLDSAQYQVRLNDFDFDMIVARWVNSLSPGNEQAIYWGSAAADTPGSRNYAGIKQPAIDALIPRITAAERREDLVTAVRALDRVLVWGSYSLVLPHFPADRLAVTQRLAWPERLPANGFVLESWWQKASETMEKPENQALIPSNR